ncbi:Colicin V production protein [Aquisphaera giovannonii]|uniref:Colicin V production protein n=1 Tax=Aquisphaera giovannonii TaxID=406548 RepID=A0A5B9WC40_9BACT|nr:CvpA family protein [Aquisphaera giovannonii]QEH38238.1 Colicin V production protein [Aquisphaera giovannonii]
MGLDLALGVVVLLAGIRGWLRGFVSQVVRLVGFVSCFYLADPVRDLARPYVAAKLPTVDPPVLDRILWWVAAVLSYVLLVGLTSLAIALIKRPAEKGAVTEGRHANRLAGFLLGASKGALLAAVLAAGVAKYGPAATENLPWAARQTEGSHALKWTAQYQPVPKIWALPPVRHFVQHIQRNGRRSMPEAEAEAEAEVTKQMAGKASDDLLGPAAPRMELPRAEEDEPGAPPSVLGLDPEVVEEIERYKRELDARPGPR